MSRTETSSSCVREIPLGLASGQDWSPEVLIRDTGPRHPLLGPSQPAQPERRRYPCGPCQVWETGQGLALSQPQMLAWVAVPGAAFLEDPLGGVGGGVAAGPVCCTPTAVHKVLCSAPYQPHLTNTFGKWVLSLASTVG